MSDEDQTVVDPAAAPAAEVIDTPAMESTPAAEEGAKPTTEGTTAE